VNSDANHPMKVAFLTNIVSPYRRPVFQELAKTSGWDLRVLVNAKTEFDREWSGACEGVEVVQPKSWSIKRTRVSKGPVACPQVVEFHIPVGLWGELSRFAPDVVITHELGPRSWIAAQWARWHKKPLVVWSYQSRSSSSVGGRMRTYVRNSILKTAGSVVGMGVQARDVLENFGVGSDRIIDAPNATDLDMVRTRLQKVRADGTVEALKQRLGNGKRICLVAGRLEPVKHIEGTLDMWSRLPQDVRDQWNLVFLGNGALKPLLDDCQDPSVIHEPSVPMEQMADYYAASDLHLFASLADVWGLVVNESMLAGVPTMCSTLAGCADDMIEHGKNGLLFDPTYHESSCNALREALQRDDLAKLGRAALWTGEEFTIERLADGFREGVRQAMARRKELVPAPR